MNIKENTSQSEGSLLCMIREMTLLRPPIQCSQLILVESYSNSNNDYPSLLHTVDVMDLKLELLIEEYHHIIGQNNKYYPLRRSYPSQYCADLISFHPLVAMYEFAPSQRCFIGSIAVQNESILAEFFIANFIFQSNPILLHIMFQILADLELDSEDHRNCIYHKIHSVLHSDNFAARYHQSDISKSLEILQLHLARRVTTETDDEHSIIGTVLSNLDTFHLVESLLVHDPLFIFQRLAQSQSVEGCIHLFEAITKSGCDFGDDNESIFILTVSTLLSLNAPQEILSKRRIEVFITKTNNCWDRQASYLQSKSRKECDADLRQCHQRLIESISQLLELSEYLPMFESLKPLIELIHRDKKRLCCLKMSRMWIETKPATTYDIWSEAANKTLKCNPQTVMRDVNGTKHLIQRIMGEFKRIIDDQNTSGNVMDFTKYPMITLSESLMFIVRILHFSSKQKITIYHDEMLKEQYISTLMMWYDAVCGCLTGSDHNEVLYSVLALFKELCKTDQDLFISVAVKLWKSCSITYEQWRSRLSDDDVTYNDGACRCQGVGGGGCTKNISNPPHSLNITALILYTAIGHKTVGTRIIKREESNCAIFCVLEKLMCLCHDATSWGNYLQFAVRYLSNIIDDEKADCSTEIGEIIRCNSEERKAMHSVAKRIKTLFELNMNKVHDGSRRLLYDEIIKFWAKYLEIESEAAFQVLVNIDSHLLALESLFDWSIRNGPALLSSVTEKAIEYQRSNAAGREIKQILRDIKKPRFTERLIDLHSHWNDRKEDQEISAQRIANMLDALRNIMEMKDAALNNQLMSLKSDRDPGYPLLLYSMCQLLPQWKSGQFDMDDIGNLIEILVMAFNNNHFTEILVEQRESRNDKLAVIEALVKTLLDVINNEDDAEAKDDALQSLQALQGIVQRMFHDISSSS